MTWTDTFREKEKEFDSFCMALIYLCLKEYVHWTMAGVLGLFGVRKEAMNLRQAEIYLVGTTLLIMALIVGAHIWLPLGWVLVVLGNLRILQILSINLMTIVFDFTPVGNSPAALKRARWHFLALGFSFLDIVLTFSFMYWFFDVYFKILNQHFSDCVSYFYYTMVTIATLGYGDIVPVTVFGKIIATYQVFVSLFFLIFVVSGVTGRFQRQV